MATIKGKWLFNDVVQTHFEWLNEYQIENVCFYSNGERFTDIYWVDIPTDEDMMVYHIYYADTLAVRGYYGDISDWENEAFKTIEFEGEQEVSENFVAWMQANATQQAVNTPVVTYDLSQLKLDKGTHFIKVVAKADGYASARSNVIEYVVRGITVTELAAVLPGYGACAAAITIGEKIWVFGSSSISIFDPNTNTLTVSDATLSPSYTQRAVSMVGTKIYLFGGHILVQGSYAESVDAIHVFDTETNTIQALSVRLPTALERIASAVVGTKIYLFGGYHYPRQNYTDSYYSVNTIRVFDTETNALTTLDITLPAACYYLTATAVGTKIYLFGGTSGLSSMFDTIHVFDTETNTIKTLSTTLPTALWAAGSAVMGKKIYLFGGGLSGSSNYANAIHVFDTKTDTIITLDETIPYTSGACGIVAASVGKNIYLFGGSAGSSGYNAIVEVQT